MSESSGQSDAASLSAAEIQQLAERTRATFTQRWRSGQFDNLTVQELKVKAVQEADQIMQQEKAASIVSIVVIIIFV